jgi:hypothetical protein
VVHRRCSDLVLGVVLGSANDNAYSRRSFENKSGSESRSAGATQT